MSSTSNDFLHVNRYPSGKKQRSHSSGHVDRLEEQERVERRDRERQMKEYHENTRHVSKAHQRTRSDHLSVPIWETHRRPRSSERSEGQPHSTLRNYCVEEFRPDPKLYDYDMDPEPSSPRQLSMPVRGRTHQDKPKLRVPPIVIQDNPPLPSKSTGQAPPKGPSASPHSPTAQPVLQVQYGTLQHKLAQVCSSCERYLDVEPADPRDLTFFKIHETVEGHADDLHIWSHVVNLDGLARIDKSMRHLVDMASEVLDRLIEKATALREACANAKPKDLKMPLLDESDSGDEIDIYDNDDHNVSAQDPTEGLGFVINSLLQSIEMQIRHLKLLSPSLQEATPDVEDEMAKVAKLVKETGKFFGSEAAMERYSVDSKPARNIAL